MAQGRPGSSFVGCGPACAQQDKLHTAAPACRYVDLQTDPERRLLGGKRRVLMAKGASMFMASSPFSSISTNLLQRLQELPTR